jgi:hypothetical protein
MPSRSSSAIRIDRARAIALSAQAGDAVGVQVGDDRHHQLADEWQVALDLLQHRVDSASPPRRGASSYV